MNSTRLPGKTLIPIKGKTLLEHHFNRLKWSGLPVFLATTLEPEAEQLLALAAANQIPAMRGSTDDVLTRFYLCAKMFGLEIIVRVTSDCPLIDGNLISAGVREFLAQPDWKQCYLSNTLERSLPRGLDFEIFSFESLRHAYLEATTTPEREHVTPFIYRSGAFRTISASYSLGSDFSRYRITVDTPEDLELIRALIEAHGADELPVPELVKVMLENPSLEDLNKLTKQKEV